MINRKGTAYVEYFILAGAMAVAAAVLWQNGSYQGATAALEGEFDTQMKAIKGSVPVD